MKNIELAVFDLDGTLIEFHHEYLFSQTQRLLPKLGHRNVELGELSESFSSFDYFRFVLEDERDNFASVFWELFDWDNFPDPVVFDGVETALSELSNQGIRLALATSRLTTEQQLSSLLKPTGILEHMETIVCRTDPKVHWSDKTQLLKKVCKRLGVVPERALMTGDIPTDVISARSIGMGLTAAVRSGGMKDSVLKSADPDFLISDVTELPTVLFGCLR